MGTKNDEEGFWISKLRQMPKWVLFLVIAALYTLLMLGKGLLTGEILEPSRIVITAVVGLAVAASIFWFTRWQLRREHKEPAGWPTVTNVKSAISTGRLPEHAKAEQWIPELTKTIRLERHMAWIGLLIFGAFTAMGIFLIIDNPEHPWFWVIATVLFAALAVWYPIWTPRRRQKLEGLIAQLPAEDRRDDRGQ